MNEGGNVSYDKAIVHLQQCLRMAKEFGDKSGEGALHRQLGLRHFRMSNFDKAISHLQQGLEIAKEIGEKNGEGEAYGNLGACYQSIGQYDKAISHFQQGLGIAGKIGYKYGELAAYQNLGVCHQSLGQYDKAILHLRRGQEIAKEIGDKSSEGTALKNLGICYGSLGQYDKEICHLEESLKVVREIGHKKDEAAVCQNLGVCYQSLGKYDRAISHLQDGLNIAKDTQDKSGEGVAYQTLAACYESVGQYEQAISHFQGGLKIAKDIKDKSGEEVAYQRLGSCYRSIEQCDKAISYLQQALTIAKETENRSGEGVAYRTLGGCYEFLGQYEKAILHLQKGLKTAKDIQHKSGEGVACLNLGVCFQSIGLYNEAILQLRTGLEISNDIGDRDGEGVAYRNLGLCYQNLGQYDKGILHSRRGLEIANDVGEKRGVGVAHQNLGTCYESLGQYDKAIYHFQKGLYIAKEIGNNSLEGEGHKNLGSCYLSLRQYDKALPHLNQGLDIAKEIGDKGGVGVAYGNLGIYYRCLRQHDKAIQNVQRSLEIAKEIGDKNSERVAYQRLGVCYQSLGQYDKAISHFQEGLDISREIGNKSGETICYRNLGTLRRSAQDYENAERMLRNSVKCLKELFSNAPNVDAYKLSFMDTFMGTFENLIDSLVCQGKTDEALIVAEDGRAMPLKYFMKCPDLFPDSSSVDQLNLLGIQEIVKSICCSEVIFFALLHCQVCTWIIEEDGQIGFLKIRTEEELEKERSLELLVNKMIKLMMHEEVEVERGDNSLPDEDTLEAMGDRYWLRDTRVALGGLVSTLLELMTPENEPVLCDDRSLSFLYPGASKSNEETIRSLPRSFETSPSRSCDPPLSVEVQNSRVSPGATNPQQPGTPEMTTHQENGHNRNKSPKTDELINALLAFMYKLLLYPVRQHIAGSQIVIVPDGPLALVPFAALVDENSRYVAESGVRIRLVPSLAAAHTITKRPRNPIRKALIIGNPYVGEIVDNGETIPVPGIPSAAKEAQQIGKVLSCKPLVGRAATKEKFLRNVESADLIHIAAHGDAERGEILLAAPAGTAQDQPVAVDEVMLKMSDLEGKRIQAQLVVLSSCYSARGTVHGEGVVGMARVFLAAGARAVLVTLWAVDDAVTNPMIIKFYEGLWHGRSASEALSDAMKLVRGIGKKFRHPRFWAPFILLGDDVSPLGEQGCNIQTAVA